MPACRSFRLVARWGGNSPRLHGRTGLAPVRKWRSVVIITAAPLLLRTRLDSQQVHNYSLDKSRNLFFAT